MHASQDPLCITLPLELSLHSFPLHVLSLARPLVPSECPADTVYYEDGQHDSSSRYERVYSPLVFDNHIPALLSLLRECIAAGDQSVGHTDQPDDLCPDGELRLGVHVLVSLDTPEGILLSVNSVRVVNESGVVHKYYKIGRFKVALRNSDDLCCTLVAGCASHVGHPVRLTGFSLRPSFGSGI